MTVRIDVPLVSNVDMYDAFRECKSKEICRENGVGLTDRQCRIGIAILFRDEGHEKRHANVIESR